MLYINLGGLVHICNPSCLGGKDWEDCSLRIRPSKKLASEGIWIYSILDRIILNFLKWYSHCGYMERMSLLSKDTCWTKLFIPKSQKSVGKEMWQKINNWWITCSDILFLRKERKNWLFSFFFKERNNPLLRVRNIN
jgi:hypothetical protein